MPDSQTASRISYTTLQSLAGDLGRYGEKEAVAYFDKRGDHRWSYLTLASHVERLASGLIEHGIKVGARLAISARNRPEWIAACLASLRCGAVVVPLDTQLGDRALHHALQDSGARLLFTTGAEAGRLRPTCRELGVEIILLEDEDAHIERGERSWLNLTSPSAGARDLPNVSEENEAMLFYTSGTTGAAKGVPLSNRNLMFQIRAIADANFVREDDRVLLPLPLHHVYPLVIGTLTPLALGLSLIIPSAFTGSQVLQAMQRGRATLIIGVPRLYEALIAGLEARLKRLGRLPKIVASGLLELCILARRHFRIRLGRVLMAPLRVRMAPDLRMVVSGGAALNPEIAWKLEGLGWLVATGYGLTETAPLLTINLPDSLGFETAGEVVCGVELRIDTSAAPEGAHGGELGEVLAQGPGVFKGYLNLQDKTAEAFTADGWFRTGDLGWLDSSGRLHLAGRRSTMIVTAGGENVQPDTIEEACQKHPAIEEIAVLEYQGKIVGLIVPKVGAASSDAEATVRKAIADMSRTLPSYQRLADFALTQEAIPRTRLGKPRRHLLAERYEQAKRGDSKAMPERRAPMTLEEMSADDHALLEDPAARAAWDWLVARYADRRLTPDSNLNVDLGVDSMEWLNISLEIAQRTGAEITEEAISRMSTVRDLLAEVAGGGEAQGLAQAWIEDPEAALNDSEKRWLQPLGPISKILSLVLYWTNYALMRTLFRLRYSGLENLPARGPFIIAPNHTSFLDPVALAASLEPRLLRCTYWAGWTGVVFKGPIRRALARLAQAVPIDPRRGAASSIALGAAVLKRNMTLVWFPEGQRSPDGRLQPSRPGLGVLLQHFPVPVVPVVIEGAYAAWPRQRLFPRFRPLAVHIHPPVDWRSLEQRSSSDQPSQRIVDALHAHLARLLGDTASSQPSS
jgi:long-chain acyl-CoA synthetase